MIQDTFNTDENQIRELLKQIPDPEVEVNIVDLGLIYQIKKNNTDNKIIVDMTLSTPGCPVGDTIVQHVHNLLEANFSDFEIQVNLIWEPEWTPDLISAEGKAMLN